MQHSRLRALESEGGGFHEIRDTLVKFRAKGL